MMRTSSYSAVIIVCASLLAWAIVSHAHFASGVGTKIDETTAMRMAYETIETVRNNTDLVREIEKLEAQKEQYRLSLNDKNKIKQDLEDKKSQFEIINGTQPAVGRGVEIVVSGNLVTEEMADLINGIRNVKPLAIGINGRRVVFRSYFVIDQDRLEFDNQYYDFPVTIQVMGDPDDLQKSLDRSGGILDVIAKNSFGKASFSLTTKEEMTLPAHDQNLRFYYARIIQ